MDTNPPGGLWKQLAPRTREPTLEWGAWSGFLEAALTMTFCVGDLASQLLAECTAVKDFKWTPCCGLLFYSPGALCGPNRQSLGNSKGQRISSSTLTFFISVVTPQLPPPCFLTCHRCCLCNTLSAGIWGVESNEYQLWRETAVKKGSCWW